MKKVILIMLTVSLMLIIGCYTPSELPADNSEQMGVEQLPESNESMTENELKTCNKSEECENLLCIDGSCRSIASLYDTSCTNKCSLDNVVIGTSDGETYTFKKGQGSFTFAGAIEWKIESFPDYCPSDRLRIPIKILKKSAGKVLETQVVTLAKGETSKLIIHPTIERVKFTANLKEINEECS